MHAAAELTAAVPDVFDALADLSTYPEWLTIVQAAEPVAAADGDPGPSWAVDLVGRLGFVTRRKRVRMVRTESDPGTATVCFERRELDGQSHSPWTLRGSARAGADGGTEVALHIHYGGTSFLPGADLLLRGETRRAGERLEAVIAARRPGVRGSEGDGLPAAD